MKLVSQLIRSYDKPGNQHLKGMDDESLNDDDLSYHDDDDQNNDDDDGDAEEEEEDSRDGSDDEENDQPKQIIEQPTFKRRGEHEITVFAAPSSNKDISRDVLAQSRRGRELGGEGLWNEELGEAEKVKQIVTKHRREDQKQQAAKRTTEWDQLLDQGKLKKLKADKFDEEDIFERENQFQKLQNKFIDGSVDRVQHSMQSGSFKHKRNMSKPRDWNDNGSSIRSHKF